MTTIRKDAECSGVTTLALVTQDGEELTYCRQGFKGDKNRPWAIWAGIEPRCLSHLDPREKQMILDTLHRCSASLSITL